MRWTGFTLFAFAIACAEPTRPASVVGTWTLVTVDGSQLPATIVPRLEIVSGKLELKPDGTYEELTDTRMAGAPSQTLVHGEWRVSGGIVELLDRIVGLPFVGHWNGSSLAVQGEREMKYTR